MDGANKFNGADKFLATIKVKVIKVDKETLRHTTSYIFVRKESSVEAMLKMCKKGCNVGDFVILPQGKTFRRIRRGFREANAGDYAELVGSQL